MRETIPRGHCSRREKDKECTYVQYLETSWANRTFAKIFSDFPVYKKKKCEGMKNSHTKDLRDPPDKNDRDEEQSSHFSPPDKNDGDEEQSLIFCH